jgi:hypothetical protein
MENAVAREIIVVSMANFMAATASALGLSRLLENENRGDARLMSKGGIRFLCVHTFRRAGKVVVSARESQSIK